MPKRVIAQDGAQPEKAAKIANSGKFDPVCDLVNLSAHLPESCRAMLSEMAPHCLSTARNERHRYQQAFADVLLKLASDVEAQQEKTIQAAETKVAEVNAEKDSTNSALASAKSNLAAACTQRDSKASDLQKAEQGVVGAKEALESAKAAVASFELDRAAIIAKKETIEEMVKGKWEPAMQAHEVPSYNWKKRNALIDTGIQALEVPESLQAALQAALKKKPSNRTSFGEISVDFAQNLINKRIAAVNDEIESANVEASRKAAAVAAAEQTLSDAEASRETAASALETSCENLKAAEDMQTDATQVCEQKRVEATKLLQGLEEQQSSLTAVKEKVRELAVLESGEQDAITEEK